MKLTSAKSDEERLILTACIVHDSVLGTVHAKLGGETRPFENKWSNSVLSWCRSYHAKYQKAPRKHIKQLFQRYAEKIQDEDQIALVEAFLSRLSKDYQALAEEMNEKYLLDTASRYFERVALQRHADEIQAALENRDLDEARAKVTSFKSVDFSSTAWKDPFDRDMVKKVVSTFEDDPSIIRWGGAVGRFFARQFKRGGFVAFQAPEKKGKSFWLLETVYLALKQRRKVLYYVIGDMSEEQALLRLYGRITRRPYDESADIKIPETLKKQKEGPPTVTHRSEYREKPTTKEVLKAVEKLRQATASKELSLKIRCVPAYVVSVSEIEQEAKQFAKDGWVPDVIVIDYVDLVAPEPHTKQQDLRHQINASWAVLRRISLELNCLVCTATQAAASSYDAKTIRKKDFSEDKRKNAHISGLIGLNQTAEEKLLGVYRVNWIFLRDGRWADTQVCYVAGELAIASPCIISAF